MAEAVASLLASAFVSIAKDKLGSAIAGQTTLLCNFGVDLEDMMDVFESISAVLEDAERRSVKEKLVRLWLKRLKDVALDISDMLEDYQDTRDQTTSKMPGVLSCLPVAYKKIVVANRMKRLREKLKKIRNGVDSFNFIKDSSTTKEQPYDERETTSNLPEQPLIGRDREKQKIIKLLSANTNNDEMVIVPICGLGGMGKSTLAKLVYNDAQFKTYDHRIWVYVSQEFNLNKIGSSIISQLPSEGGPQTMGIQQVINQCLEKLLQGKKVLIVLDDLWQEKENELEKLRSMLHVKGSKVHVIVTTRNEEIARKLSTSELHKLRPLDDNICWEIIKRSSRFELKPNKEEIEQIGLDIAKKCGGVPLAAQSIGYMLQPIDDLSGWTKINTSDFWNGSSEDSDVLPSLKLSYERMPPQLRICFSFCAIFPKGHNIIEDDLVQQWVSLGFIEQSKGKEYFNTLLGMSFLQVSKLHLTSQKHLVRYNMHDLVHDLARLTMADELLVFGVAPQRNTRVHKYCRYLLLRKDDRTMNLANMPSKLTALRFSVSGELNIPSGAFSFAKCLRTLDFSECSGIMLPASIGKLKQLRCLIAPRIHNESLPKCITELSKLEYLNINGSFEISALPDSVDKLGCLKYLCLSGCSGISKLPESFGDLKSMVHLDMSGCSGIRELPDSLGKLMNLQHLDLSGCSRVEVIPEPICGLRHLQYLNMSSCECLDWLPKGIGDLVDLKYLNMSRCYGIRELPESLLKLSMTNLEHLDLSWNDDLECLPASIGNLKRLHTLDLTGCCNLKSLPEGLRALHELKSLVLRGCSDGLVDQASSLVHFSQTLPDFKVHVDDDVNGCSNLQLLEGINVSELRIRCLENVRSLEEANKVKLSEKQNLSYLSLAWTRDAVRLLEDKDLLGQLMPPICLKHMRLEGYSSEGFPGWLMGSSRHLSNLVSIELVDMSTCRDLPPLGQLPHLEKLVLWDLPAIKRIDGEFCGGKGAFRRLSSFHLIWMEGLEEWSTTYSVEDGVEEFMFPVLDHLHISHCPRLMYDSCQSTRLFHHFPNLQELRISGGRHTRLPESMQQLTSLVSLTLEWCDGISALPEWLSDLSSLKSLVILGCSTIESLPSCIQHMPKLRKIEIKYNQKLKEWCKLKENKIIRCED